MWRGKFQVLLVFVFALVLGQKNPYDHQTKTYYASHKPVRVTNAGLSLEAYFSPDHSVDTLTKLVESAQNTLDIGTPGWNSWSGCTSFTGGGGCSFEKLRESEEFPIFRAVLNAIHRGVRVRILTNNYETFPGTGMAYPLSFLAVAGAEVRYYTSTSFYHAKYMMADDEEASVSSVNYSWTSFMHNREAGIIIKGEDSGPLIKFLNDMFEADWNQAPAWPLQNYNQSDIDVARDKSKVDVPIPPPQNIPGAYVTSVYPVDGSFDLVELFASPDYAFDVMSGAMNESKSSLSVYIYQITGGGFCDILIDRHKAGVKIDLLTSDEIFSRTDYYSAKACYTKMADAGIEVYQTNADMYSYSHQKIVIVDGKTTLVSTGNLGSTDYPDSNVFPPYGQPGWIKANRDLTIKMVNEDMANVFLNVMTEDKQRGHRWYPDD